MGKGKRLKQERREAAAAPLVEQTPSSEMLLEAVGAVGEAFGDHADCAAAAALLRLTAGHLGFELTPRPVSLIARQQSTGDFALLGPKAYEKVPANRRDKIENYLPGGRNTGHMVLTAEDPRWLFDPNLRQLSEYGMPAPSVAFPIKSTSPEDGGWSTSAAGLDLSYLVDDENTSLWDRYERALKFYEADALRLANLLKNGATPATIKKAMGSIDRRRGDTSSE